MQQKIQVISLRPEDAPQSDKLQIRREDHYTGNGVEGVYFIDIPVRHHIKDEAEHIAKRIKSVAPEVTAYPNNGCIRIAGSNEEMTKCKAAMENYFNERK